MSFSEQMMSQGWVPGFPNYTGDWEGYTIAYFYGVAWHRKEQ